MGMSARILCKNTKNLIKRRWMKQAKYLRVVSSKSTLTLLKMETK